MNIGIIGSGNIASWIADILQQLNSDQIKLYAVSAPLDPKVQEFADRWGFEKVHKTVEELVSDAKVDIVYVAVPNPFHYEMCMLALEHGKNVVVEKPFAINDKQAAAMIAKAKEKGVFLSEALWPSFLPSRRMIDDIISSGEIGEVTGGKLQSLTNVMFLERVTKLETGGGALLDMGPYVLGRMTDHFGWDIKSVTGDYELLDTGVDARDYFTVEYNSGIKVECAVTINTPREDIEVFGEHGWIYGTKGTIKFDSLSNPRLIEILDLEGNLVRSEEIPPQIKRREKPFVGGYENEWIAFEKALSEGKTETDEAPLAMTLKIAEVMTELRRQAGVIFPFE